MAFDGRKAKGGPTITVDNTGKSEPGPVDTLLIALAACTVRGCSDDPREAPDARSAASRSRSRGKRANAVPARLTHIHLRYVVDGEGIDRPNTLRAIELAVTKYCFGTGFAREINRDRVVIGIERVGRRRRVAAGYVAPARHGCGVGAAGSTAAPVARRIRSRSPSMG
jgi:putative redox protein